MAARAFFAVATQWREGGTGLDYAGVEAGLRMEGIVLTPDDWRGLRAIEAGAAQGFRDQAERT